MSLFADENRKDVKYYAIVDLKNQTVVGTGYTVQGAHKVLTELHKNGHHNLIIHNLTHLNCPEWLKVLIKSDKLYCSRRAAMYTARANSDRRSAAIFIGSAQRNDKIAAEWHAFSLRKD